MDFTNFVSPKSGVPLHHTGDSLAGNDESFRIVGGIPRFVDSDNYCKGFGLQWNTFQRTQFDSYTGCDITEQRLEVAFGEPLSNLEGLRVLEAGSGAGRFTEILLKHGANVYSFDVSDAVEANHQNNAPHENLTLFQADIEHIPFSNDFFDVVLCVGVLQHTPSTTSSLEQLTRVLKPGGTIVCDHYKFHRGMFTSFYLPYWWAIKRLNPELQLRVTDALTRFFFPIHWYFKDRAAMQVLLRRISPINFYYGSFPLPKEMQFEWSRLDTHDRNTDHYKRHITASEFQAIFQQLNYSSVRVSKGGTGLVCRGIK